MNHEYSSLSGLSLSGLYLAHCTAVPGPRLTTVTIRMGCSTVPGDEGGEESAPVPKPTSTTMPGCSTVFPAPSCPWLLLPQHLTPPPVTIAHVCVPPAANAVAVTPAEGAVIYMPLSAGQQLPYANTDLTQDSGACRGARAPGPVPVERRPSAVHVPARPISPSCTPPFSPPSHLLLTSSIPSHRLLFSYGTCDRKRVGGLRERGSHAQLAFVVPPPALDPTPRHDRTRVVVPQG
jgi:hypothetical protein